MWVVWAVEQVRIVFYDIERIILIIYLSIFLYILLTPEGDIRRVPVNQVLSFFFFFFFLC